MSAFVLTFLTYFARGKNYKIEYSGIAAHASMVGIVLGEHFLEHTKTQPSRLELEPLAGWPLVYIPTDNLTYTYIELSNMCRKIECTKIILRIPPYFKLVILSMPRGRILFLTNF